ncbi:MAG TPA: hypothetical protein VG168_18365, partial [Bryobacteraceae bacterium]|nr:hypothetical protein [Bryobacteraceae bacterium]
YDHVAMMNGRANQLTEMVPLERSFSEIGRYIKAGATEYFLVNTSDIPSGRYVDESGDGYCLERAFERDRNGR